MNASFPAAIWRARWAFAACAAIGALLLQGAAYAQTPAWMPSKNVEIVVASGAGGASDRTARVLQKLLQDTGLFPSLTLVNRPGGGGTVGWTYLDQRAGDPHYIATFSSS
jgi:putative tricarboxylic transport membrane protein